MKTRTTLAALTVILAATVASAQPKGMSDADTRELAQYRLTMDTVNKVVAATRAMALEAKKDPRFQEAMKIDAEIKALEAKEERTEADEARLEKLTARKEELGEGFAEADMTDAKSLSDMAAQIEKFPPMAKGLRAAGMTPREYATFMLAMIQASMVAGFQKSGMMKEIPREVNPENVKFILAHEKELQALQKEMQALNPGR
jgi:hypothetical protein